MRRLTGMQLLFCAFATLVCRQTFAIGECHHFETGVDLVLSEQTTTARAAGTAKCFASNGQVNFEGSFSGQIKVHQINPAIDYESPVTGTGEWIGSVTAPANYQWKTCYQGFLSVSSGSTNGSAESAERCTPDPPPPPPPCQSCGCDGTFCENSPTCPVILDLNGDGIHTTSIADPVRFWTDYDGEVEATAWTDPATDDAFLWIDLNQDHTAQVQELFGSRMRQPGGTNYPNGYEALSHYDLASSGGNGDGMITQADAVWNRLRLWVDRNHDGVSQNPEISVLPARGIVALDLNRSRGYSVDPNGNELYLVGRYVVRTHGNHTETRLMADIEFQFVPYD